MQKKKAHCLLMCATPLQVLIAERIIELNPNKTFDLIFTKYSNDNKAKFDYYFDRLRSQCSKSLNWIYAPGLSNFLRYKYTLYKSGFHDSYDELYLSNIERRHFQYFVSQSPKAKVYTYDDGMGNINPLSKFYSNATPSFIRKSIWRVLGVKDHLQDVREKSKLHYTIYNGIPNIINNTKYISIFDRATLKKDERPRETLKIYLGQPLRDIHPKFTDRYILNTIEHLDITFYYPHPRETNPPKGSVQFIDSQLICEDYIIKALKEHPNINIEIYSFVSSVLVNLVGIDRVKVYYIYDSYLQDINRQFYDIAKERYGIESVII